MRDYQLGANEQKDLQHNKGNTELAATLRSGLDWRPSCERAQVRQP